MHIWECISILSNEDVVCYNVTVLFAQTNAASFFDFLTKNKDAFDSLESIATIAGIVIAGIWTWMLFVRKREKYPRADLKHRIEFWDISENERLVRVALLIENKSDVLLRLFDGYTWIQQMKPWPTEVIEKYKDESRNPEEASAEAGWLLVSEKIHKNERELEPKEYDELSMDFIIGKEYEQILVYSFFENSQKPGRHLGWTSSTVIDFTQNSGVTSQQAQGLATQKPRPESAQSQPKPKPDGTKT
jgi:hypothetical protein